MTKDYRQGIKGILSLGPAPTKPRIIKSETDPYEDLFSLDTPVDLTPLVTPKVETKVTPKVKKEGPMQRRAKELRWIARPKLTEEDIQNKEFWEGYNNSEKMVEYINKYGDGPKIEAPKKYPVTPEHFTDKIQEQDLERRKREITKQPRRKTDEQI